MALTLMALGAAPLARAQDSASSARGGWLIQPRLGLTQTWTDNLTLRATERDAAFVTELSPGISLRSNGGRLRGSLDYSLSGILYTKSNEKNRTQSALAGQGLAELVDGRLFVDMRASISQQTTSAFGSQTPDTSLANPNRSEVANLGVSPYLKGQLASLASYELRGNFNTTNTKDSLVGDNTVRGLSLNLQGLMTGPLNWWSTATTQQTTYKRGNDNRNTAATVGLSYRPDVDWRLSANVGRERNDYLSGVQQSSNNYGASVQWTPTERTTVSGDYQHHDYGNSHSLSFEHRMSRSSWRVSDIQSVQLGTEPNSIGARTNYDLLYQQFASLEPDPLLRDQLVRAYLQALGLSPDAIATSGFLTAGPSQMRRQEVSFSLTGVRTTITAVYGRTDTRVLGTTTQQGDLGQSSRVVQRGGSVSLAYRLTPDDSASLLLSRQDSRGDGADQSTSMKSISANWNGRLGRLLTFGLGARHVWFDSSLSPYRENAVFANLVQQF